MDGRFVGHRKLVKERCPVGEKGPEDVFSKHKVRVGLGSTHSTGEDKETYFIPLFHPSHVFSCRKRSPLSLLTGDACLTCL